MQRRFHFNPRSLTGATFLMRMLDVTKVFQSTLPHGSDLMASFAALPPVNFNPRSLTGATLSLIPKGLKRVFQSTLPHGSDLRFSGFISTPSYFNPRSLTGATCSYIFVVLRTQISIHAPSRERRSHSILKR